ncbi:hypothetical protein [Fischerella thermalis]|jgi:hypothetical protein|nr:hypothetical protein [Fischerella thermalis]
MQAAMMLDILIVMLEIKNQPVLAIYDSSSLSERRPFQFGKND